MKRTKTLQILLSALALASPMYATDTEALTISGIGSYKDSIENDLDVTGAGTGEVDALTIYYYATLDTLDKNVTATNTGMEEYSSDNDTEWDGDAFAVLLYSYGNLNTITSDVTLTSTTGTGAAYGIGNFQSTIDEIYAEIIVTTQEGEAFGIDNYYATINSVQGNITVNAGIDSSYTETAYGIYNVGNSTLGLVTGDIEVYVTGTGTAKGIYSSGQSQSISGSTGNIYVYSEAGNATGIEIYGGIDLIAGSVIAEAGQATIVSTDANGNDYYNMTSAISIMKGGDTTLKIEEGTTIAASGAGYNYAILKTSGDLTLEVVASSSQSGAAVTLSGTIANTVSNSDGSMGNLYLTGGNFIMETGSIGYDSLNIMEGATLTVTGDLLLSIDTSITFYIDSADTDIMLYIAEGASISNVSGTETEIYTIDFVLSEEMAALYAENSSAINFNVIETADSAESAGLSSEGLHSTQTINVYSVDTDGNLTLLSNDLSMDDLVTSDTIPEPGTASLSLLGLLALLQRRRRAA